MSDPVLLAVTGNPILHSQSPAMFNAAMKAMGIEGAYFRLAASDASHALRMFRRMGLAGMNVTSPFKESLAKPLDGLTDAAKALGAVNTIRERCKMLIGFNTDPDGVTGALKANSFDPKGADVLVIGAGGAGKAAAYALKNSGAKTVTIANRTFAKAKEAAERTGCDAVSFDKISAQLKAADLMISCLPRNVCVIQADALHENLTVFDANYGSTELTDMANDLGCKIIPGIDWLLYQGVAAFEILFRTTAPVVAMKQALAEPENSKDGIALIGFMGVGKTTVGQQLAGQLGYGFLDLDQEIETKQKMPIAEIFKQHGEPEFRKLESRTIFETDFKGRVVALGGGAVTNPQNLAIVKERATIIWLWAPFNTCSKRGAGPSRPLMADQSKARALFSQRAPIYSKAADLAISAEADVQGIVDTLVAQIKQRKNA